MRCDTCDKVQILSMHMFRDSIISGNKFRDKWISREDSARTTTVLDHNQHVHAMNIMCNVKLDIIV
jgi:hypothetical protein